MADAKKLVWIQLAQTGTFKGHPQGPFQIDTTTLDSICRNFQRDKLPIPIDAEHASEMPANSGTIPVEGAPAMGWIHGLDNRGNGGLWGQVEWLEPACSYIKEGRYKFLSPAIRFKSKDRVTGEQTGPRLSSAAITNSPFLPDMKPLTASARSLLHADDGESVHVMSLTLAEDLAPAESAALTLSAMCYSAHEYMPQVKSALGMHELSNALECSDQLGRLRDHLDSVGGDHTQKPEGVDLAKYLMPLRSMSNVGMGSSWDDVFDTVQAMIDAAMDQHVAEYHDDVDAASASMSAQPAETPAVVLTAAADPVVETPAPQLQAAEPTTAAAAADPLTAPAVAEPDPAKVTEPVLVASTPAADIAPAIEPPTPAAAAAEQETQPIPEAATVPAQQEEPIMATNPATTESADVTLLSLKLQTAESELESLRAENTRLLTWKENREEADLVAEVSVAYETHRETKKLKPDNKTAMLTLLRANPEAFRQLYPATPLAYRHLLQTIAATERQGYQNPAPRVAADVAPPVQAEPIRMSVRQLARQIQVKRNCPLGVAQQEAERMLAAEKRRRAG